MAISTDQAQITLDFKFQADEDPNCVFFIKFHYIDDVPVVSLSDDCKNYIDLPLSLFLEVTDFLRDNQVAPQGKQIGRGNAGIGHLFKSRNASANADPTPSKTIGKLPLPNVKKSHLDTEHNEEEQSFVDGTGGLESLSGIPDSVINGPIQRSNEDIPQEAYSRPVIRGGEPHGRVNDEKSIRRK